MMSDLLWLDLVQTFGVGGERLDPRVAAGWAELATDLDPKYFNVYYASAINLLDQPYAAPSIRRLLVKGEANVFDWRLPFVRGYLEYFVVGDAGGASEYWAKAAHMPRAPFWMISLAARARAQGEGSMSAEAMLEDLIPRLAGRQQEEAKWRLKAIRSEPLLGLYDAACKKLEAETGARPSAQQIFMQGLVEQPPQDLFGEPITFDENCIAHTEQIKVREAEAMKRIGSQNVDDK